METIAKKLQNTLPKYQNKTREYINGIRHEPHITNDISSVLKVIEQLREEMARLLKNQEKYLNQNTSMQFLGEGNMPTTRGYETSATAIGENNSKNLEVQMQTLFSQMETLKNTSTFELSGIFNVLRDFEKKIQNIGDTLKNIPSHIENMNKTDGHVSLDRHNTFTRDEINSLLTAVVEIQQEIYTLYRKHKNLSIPRNTENDTNSVKTTEKKGTFEDILELTKKLNNFKENMTQDKENRYGVLRDLNSMISELKNSQSAAEVKYVIHSGVIIS
jgi:hypothetical protein